MHTNLLNKSPPPPPHYTKELGTDHIIDVPCIFRQFLVQVAVEARDHKVAVVLILHQLLDAVDLEPAKALAVQNPIDHLLEELLVLTERPGQIYLRGTEFEDRGNILNGKTKYTHTHRLQAQMQHAIHTPSHTHATSTHAICHTHSITHTQRLVFCSGKLFNSLCKFCS